MRPRFAPLAAAGLLALAACGSAAPSPRAGEGSLSTPVAEYGHAAGRCTVIGGTVYRGAAFPTLVGRYLFGDYCSGELVAIDPRGDLRREPERIGTTTSGLSAFGEDDSGELYVANVSEGWLGRLTVVP